MWSTLCDYGKTASTTQKKFAFKLDNSHIINLFTPRAETKAESINTTPITMKLTLQVINQMKVIE